MLTLTAAFAEAVVVRETGAYSSGYVNRALLLIGPKACALRSVVKPFDVCTVMDELQTASIKAFTLTL